MLNLLELLKLLVELLGGLAQPHLLRRRRLRRLEARDLAVELGRTPPKLRCVLGWALRGAASRW